MRLGPSELWCFLILGLESVGPASATTGLGVKLIWQTKIVKWCLQESNAVIKAILSHRNSQLGLLISFRYPFSTAIKWLIKVARWSGRCRFLPREYRLIAFNKAISDWLDEWFASYQSAGGQRFSRFSEHKEVFVNEVSCFWREGDGDRRLAMSIINGIELCLLEHMARTNRGLDPPSVAELWCATRPGLRTALYVDPWIHPSRDDDRWWERWTLYLCTEGRLRWQVHPSYISNRT